LTSFTDDLDEVRLGGVFPMTEAGDAQNAATSAAFFSDPYSATIRIMTSAKSARPFSSVAVGLGDALVRYFTTSGGRARTRSHKPTGDRKGNELLALPPAGDCAYSSRRRLT
jgi:hypothetical protein